MLLVLNKTFEQNISTTPLSERIEMNRVLLLDNIRASLRLGLALLLALALLASPLAATPAAAAEKPSDHQYKERDNDDDNDNDKDNNNRHHKKKNNNQKNNNNNGGGGGGGSFGSSQESEQEAESAEINQSFTVTSSGDNSTQCAGVQGDAQSGNAQNLFDIEQVNSEADEVEAEEVGSTIDESPANTTTCDQQVNQAASAAADPPPFCTWWVDQYGVDVCRWSADGTDWIVDSAGSWRIYAPYAGWRTAASELATGALGTAGGLTTLGVLATLGLVGTGLAIRRTRSD